MNFIYEYWWIWFTIWSICCLAPKPQTIGVPDYHTKYKSVYGKLYSSVFAEYITIMSFVLNIICIIIALIKYAKL